MDPTEFCRTMIKYELTARSSGRLVYGNTLLAIGYLVFSLRTVPLPRRWYVIEIGILMPVLGVAIVLYTLSVGNRSD